MRGKVHCKTDGLFCVRITPAYAGKSFFAAIHEVVWWDHPRLCGEKASLVEIHSSMTGSPPPMRGKDSQQSKRYNRTRITPAYAGKSKRLLWWSGHASGSPPPMRGKVSTRVSLPSASGITPAYAGKSFLTLPPYFVNKDHPRLCGEKFCAAVMPSMLAGSPPPMRGKAVRCAVRKSCRRITPAYAGKSAFLRLSDKPRRDHPRLCGEKIPPWSGACSILGSPPPMRGKGQAFSGRIRKAGITPAYAGKS